MLVHALRFSLIALALLLSQSDLYALSLMPITDSMRIEESERIVIGRSEKKGANTVIYVEKVLKGSATPKVVTLPYSPSNGPVTQKVLWVQGAKNSRISQLSYLAEDSPRWLLYHALLDPRPLLEMEGNLEQIEAINVLGYLYEAIRIECPIIPELAERISRYNLKPELPWDFQGVVEIQVRPHPKFETRLELISLSPEGKHDPSYRRLMKGLPVDHMQNPHLGNFTLKIDTRLPTGQPFLDYQTVALFLRKTLETSEESILVKPDGEQEHVPTLSDVKIAALKALTRMRNLDSVPIAISLIEGESEQLSGVALQFLRYARDRRATEPLCQLLAVHAPNYPEKHYLSDGVSHALSRIQDPQAIPFLEAAVTHRVERAYSALAECGRAKSIGVILDSEKDHELPNTAGVALFWLVKRSDDQLEPWMDLAELEGGNMKPQVLAKWRQWWSVNRDELNLIRSWDEAFLIWTPAGLEETKPAKALPRNDWWKYLLGMGVLLTSVKFGRFLKHRGECHSK